MKALLENIYQSSIKLLAPLTPMKTYKTLVHESLKITGYEIGSILLFKNGFLKRVYSSDSRLLSLVPRKRGLLYKAARSSDPVFLTAEQTRFSKIIHPLLKKMEIKSNIIIQLAYRRKVIGILTLLSTKKNTLKSKHFIALKLFGQMASLAIIKTQMYDKAKKNLASQNLFISMASHELRNPLTTISGYLQLIQKRMNLGESIDPIWVKSMNDETTRLTLLAHEMFQVNTIRQGTFSYKQTKCDAQEILERVISNFTSNFPSRSVKYTDYIGKKAYIWGDFDKLLQIFHNILDNARKYSPAFSTIFVDISDDLSQVIFTIRDEGKGVSSYELKNITRRFYRGSANQHEGMGLGLYITKKIVTDHGGKLSITSRINFGTTITVEIPKYGKTS